MKSKLGLYSFIWLALGLGSQLQVISSLSMTEIFLLCWGPIVFCQDYKLLRQHGVFTFFNLSILVILGCAIACLYNHTSGIFALRGFAVTCIIPCAIVVAHRMFCRDMNGFKWMLLGMAISAVLCVFQFQRAVEVSMYGEDAVDITLGPLFWIERVGNFLTVPMNGWYLQTPIWCSVGVCLFLAIFTLKTSVSGRSIALVAIAHGLMILVGGKKPKTIRRISKHFFLIIALSVVGIFIANAAYRYLSMSGWMGEEARTKYERQSHGSKSVVTLLIGGRADSFVGLLACMDKPIVGWGPWAMDEAGYYEEFLKKYGDEEDFQQYLANRRANSYKLWLIPCHSHLAMFWLWYGMFGLIFIVYSIFIVIRYTKQDIWVIPQWYSWVGCAVPGFFWAMFFSPFAARFTFPLFVVACLMTRAARIGNWRIDTLD